MLKRVLPLVLFAAWAPAALAAPAFPPCAIEPLDLDPLDGDTVSGSPSSSGPWFRGWYVLVGDPTVINSMRAGGAAASLPDNKQKCDNRSALPVPKDHLGNSYIGIAPVYAPHAGFGIIALPDLRTATTDLGIRHRLDFSIDNAPLAHDDEWFDVIQLHFQWQQSSSPGKAPSTSAIYRVRKHQLGKSGTPTFELLEARAAYWGGPHARPPIFERVVATLPVDDGSDNTQLSLRLSQAAKAIGQGNEFGLPPDNTTELSESVEDTPAPTAIVDSWLEIFDANGNLLTRVDLPGQWMSELSIGLLDYRVGDASAYPNGHGVEMSNVALSAETF
jgi:hypothetical protein